MGKDSLEDDDSYGRSTTATTEENNAHMKRVKMEDRRLTVNRIANNDGISHERVENIAHMKRVAMEDRRLTVNRIANNAGISHRRVENILLNELGMAKISAR